MPSGKGSTDWLPKVMVKTASNNEGEVSEQEQYRDDLFEAAKQVVANYEEKEAAQGCGMAMGGDELAETDAVETDGVEFEGQVEEVAEGEDAAVECLERAQDAIEDAVECLGGETEDAPVEEFEMEVEEEVIEGGEECPTQKCATDENETVEASEETVEASEEDEVVEAEDEEDEVVEASADDWVKLAEISPKNRKKIYDYWSRQLGYPKDFVKLMVKDYEK